MSTQTLRASRLWSDRDHQRVLDGYYIEVAEEELQADSRSLHSMRMALAALMYDKRVNDELMPLMPTLLELELALAMAAEGEQHPALQVKKSRTGDEGIALSKSVLCTRC